MGYPGRMTPPIQAPPAVVALAHAVHKAGGRALLVGGGVRDHLLGIAVKDWDVEVFGLPSKALLRTLRRQGPVNTVGRAFGVFKLTVDGLEIDVSIPRRDSKVGPGHRGIEVEGDPHMSIEDAARRRDLTINALMLDLVTGELLDPAGGVADLNARVLRAVDADTFLEDPLRALRAVQFAARFEFDAHPTLEALCRQAPLHELPAERIQLEWIKLLLRGRRPSIGLALARRTGMLQVVFEHLVDDPDLDAAVDRTVGARSAITEPGRRLAVPLLVWLSATPPRGVLATLDRLGLHRRLGYPLRDRLVRAHAELGAAPTDDAALRHLSTRTELDLLFLAQAALHPDDASIPARRARAHELGIEHEQPARLLLGRHLASLGVPGGPRMGELLAQVYEAQLDGRVATLDDALQLARELTAEQS